MATEPENTAAKAGDAPMKGGGVTTLFIKRPIMTSLVMLWGVAFLAIITAAITSVFVARAQRERAADVAEVAVGAGLTVHDRLDQIDAQLEQLRELLERTPPAP